MAESRETRVRLLAYELWYADGEPEGGADRYWDEAERRLDADDKPGPIEQAAREAREQPRR
jgi:hypothetical protein